MGTRYLWISNKHGSVKIEEDYVVVNHRHEIVSIGSETCEILNRYHDKILGEQPYIFIDRDTRDTIRMNMRRRLIGDTTVPTYYIEKIYRKNKPDAKCLILPTGVYSDRKKNRYTITRIKKID